MLNISNVKKVNIILNSLDKWRQWLELIRAMTEQEGMWDLIKPEDDNDDGSIERASIFNQHHPNLRYK
jgi:hypothetical protein